MAPAIYLGCQVGVFFAWFWFSRKHEKLMKTYRDEIFECNDRVLAALRARNEADAKHNERAWDQLGEALSHRALARGPRNIS